MTVQTGSQPIENCLLARYTPEPWRATVYGLKFVLALGLSALGVPLIAVIVGVTGSVDGVLLAMAACSVVALSVALILPRGAPAAARRRSSRRNSRGGRRARERDPLDRAPRQAGAQRRRADDRHVDGRPRRRALPDPLDPAARASSWSLSRPCRCRPELRRALAAEGLRGPGQVARLDVALGRFFADALADVLERHPFELELIGSHGQTVYHEHAVTTLQLGAPAAMALRFGCPVVHDFRANDIAAGGAGAPLVPYVDARLLGGRGEAVLAVNIGGIANFTALPAQRRRSRRGARHGLRARQHGARPAAARFSAGAQSADIDGRLAARGRSVRSCWPSSGRIRSLPSRRPSRPDASSSARLSSTPCWPRRRRQSEQDWCDLLATAAELTAWGIHDCYLRHVAPRLPVDAWRSAAAARAIRSSWRALRPLRADPGADQRCLRAAGRCQGGDRVRDPGLGAARPAPGQCALSHRRPAPRTARQDHRVLRSGRAAELLGPEGFQAPQLVVQLAERGEPGPRCAAPRRGAPASR